MQLTFPERFKRNLLTLFSVIEDMYEEGINNDVIEEDNVNILLPAAKIYINTKNSDTMINRWIAKTYEHWDKIKEKDTAYFQEIGLKIFNIIRDKGLDRLKEEEEIKDDGFMNKISEKQISNFKNLLQGEYEYEGDTYKIFNEETEKMIWTLMDSFVKLSICYIHENRRIVDGVPVSECFPEVDVEKLSKEWCVKL